MDPERLEWLQALARGKKKELQVRDNITNKNFCKGPWWKDTPHAEEWQHQVSQSVMSVQARGSASLMSENDLSPLPFSSLIILPGTKLGRAKPHGPSQEVYLFKNWTSDVSNLLCSQLAICFATPYEVTGKCSTSVATEASERWNFRPTKATHTGASPITITEGVFGFVYVTSNRWFSWSRQKTQRIEL